jgi:peptide deformylase
MAETMYAAHGVGLAAPQIRVGERIAVIDVSREENNLIELINPVIIESKGKVPSEEGCLSIPDYRDTIQRKEEVRVQAFDRHGKSFELEATDLLAICLQHEIDL